MTRPHEACHGGPPADYWLGTGIRCRTSGPLCRPELGDRSGLAPQLGRGRWAGRSLEQLPQGRRGIDSSDEFVLVRMGW
jgi:hypothetical protein